MRSLVRRFLHDETAVTAIEYGLVASFIAVVIISSVRHLGTQIMTKFQIIETALS